MITTRLVEPEILDGLPGDEPAAIRGRRDLQLCNTLMFHAAILARQLVRHAGSRMLRMVDIGSGDGTLILAVARRLARRLPKVHITLVERLDIVSDATLATFADLGWRAERVPADVFDFFERRSQFDLVTANLFLHHFPSGRLGELLAVIARTTNVFVSAEPRRGLLPAIGCRFLWALGCNYVTRHDSAASVRAGFRGNELSALWPRERGWQLSEHEAIPFSHTFVASRSEPRAVD